MRVAILVACAVAIAASACKHDDEAKPKVAPTSVVKVGSDGVRHVAIAATKDGYVPDHIVGKPNEKLVLEVTRTHDGDCLEHLILPDKRDIELPYKKMVEIPVTVPASGESTFVCGMDMWHGALVAQP